MLQSGTLFEKAVANYNSARILRNYMSSDEEQIYIIGYHLQQALELTIKYLLELNGVEYPKSDSIEQLVSLAKSNSAELFLSEYLEDHCEMFSQWEANSRYIVGYSIELKKIDRAIKELDSYFTQVSLRISEGRI